MENKISFGFSKVVKKPQIIAKYPPPKDEEEKIELIECLEGQSIKIAGHIEAAPEAPLVIPLAANTTPLEKVKQLQEENRSGKKGNSSGSEANGTSSQETLEERAAREIMTDLKSHEDEEAAADTFAVPLNSDEIKLGGAKESTMDDYEDVPIANFGLAMLRGMGWRDEDHKAKEKRLEDDMIVCRPKGLGLGADKAMKQQVKLATNSANASEKLVMKKNAYVRIIAGKQKDFYGQVEGMDDESGRVFVKMALGGARESINENFVQLVTEKEYKENRKVLNVTRYEEFKKKETHGPEEVRKEPRDEKHREKSSRRRDEDDEKESSNEERRERRSRSMEWKKDSNSSKHSSKYKSSRDDYRDDRRSNRDSPSERSHSREGDRKTSDDYYRRDRKDRSYSSHKESSSGRRRDR